MIDNVRRVFLVDYENTSVRGLYGMSCLGPNCKVVVFCSSTVIQKAVEDVLKVYEMRNVEISTFLLIKPGKNALDFMISTYLGFEVNQSIDKEIFIVSSDHGFDSAVEMAKQLDTRMTISTHRNIFECLPPHMRQGRYDIEEGLLLEDRPSSDVLLLEDSHLGQEKTEDTPKETSEKKKTEIAPAKVEKPLPQVTKKTVSKPEQTKKEAPKEGVVSSILGVFKKKAKTEAVKEVVKVPNTKSQAAKTNTAGTDAGKPQSMKTQTEKKAQIEKKAQPEKKAPSKVQSEKETQVKKAEQTIIEPQIKKEEKVKEKLPKEDVVSEVVKSEKKKKQKVIVEVIDVEEELLPEENHPSEKKEAKKPKQASSERKYPALGKAKKQVYRDMFIQKLAEETKIPEKLHLGTASAMVNSITFSECSTKLELVFGHKHGQYIDDAESVFTKYR